MPDDDQQQPSTQLPGTPLVPSEGNRPPAPAFQYTVTPATPMFQVTRADLEEVRRGGLPVFLAGLGSTSLGTSAAMGLTLAVAAELTAGITAIVFILLTLVSGCAGLILLAVALFLFLTTKPKLKEILSRPPLVPPAAGVPAEDQQEVP